MISYLLQPETSFFGKIKNIALGFVVNIIWLAFASWLMKYLSTDDQIYDPPAKYIFFFSCIFAPLWEELVFRHAPLQVAKKLDPSYLLPIVFVSSAFFGWLHGGAVNIMFQGVGGFIMALVYIKNGYSIWSTITLHFLWNLHVIFILPFLFQ
jgi:membrane protease YdiL (CAAX protease family)